MFIVLAALMSGAVSALITLGCTQPIQHYCWKRQRQAEHQLAVIVEVNRRAAEFLEYCAKYFAWQRREHERSSTQDPSAAHREDPQPQLEGPFYPALNAAIGQVQVLFSGASYE